VCVCVCVCMRVWGTTARLRCVRVRVCACEACTSCVAGAAAAALSVRVPGLHHTPYDGHCMAYGVWIVWGSDGAHTVGKSHRDDRMAYGVYGDRMAYDGTLVCVLTLTNSAPAPQSICPPRRARCAGPRRVTCDEHAHTPPTYHLLRPCAPIHLPTTKGAVRGDAQKTCDDRWAASPPPPNFAPAMSTSPPAPTN
jgi:hypothetical protein